MSAAIPVRSVRRKRVEICMMIVELWGWVMSVCTEPAVHTDGKYGIGMFYKLVYYSIRKCSYAWPLGFALLCHDSA